MCFSAGSCWKQIIPAFDSKGPGRAAIFILSLHGSAHSIFLSNHEGFPGSQISLSKFTASTLPVREHHFWTNGASSRSLTVKDAKQWRSLLGSSLGGEAQAPPAETLACQGQKHKLGLFVTIVLSAFCYEYQ
jgi:hypothetical protein